MNQLKEWLRRVGMLATNPVNRNQQRTFLGRFVSALTFIAIILCLVLWITGFLLFQNSSIRQEVTAPIFTDLSCIIFFGGLAVAMGVGATVGNFMRRAFWEWLTRRMK